VNYITEVILPHQARGLQVAQHAQPGEVRFPGRIGHLRAHPQQAPAGRPDLGV
jgi:hypothetical protein